MATSTIPFMDALTLVEGTLDASHLADAGITDNGSRIYRYGKVVMLRIDLKSNTSGVAQNTGTWIPEGYRPLTAVSFIAGDGGATGQSVGTISANGSANIYFGSTKYTQTTVCYLTA